MSRFKQRFIHALLVTAVAMFGLGVVATPAAADDTCPTGNLCMWVSPYEEGLKQIMSLSPGACANLSGVWNNNVESFWNKSSTRYYAFTSSNCSITPATIILEPGVEYLQMSPTFRNTISSIQRAG